MRQAAKVYFETQVTTTSQGHILLMLYDGAVKFLTQAKERMAAKDYAGKGNLISSAIDIINELAGSLNAEKGGDLAANLNQLYFYCNKRLFTANLKMDPAPIDEVIKILTGLRSAYAQIVDTPEAQAAAAQAAAGRAAAAQPARVPLGVQAAPSGAPISGARAKNAYVFQGAKAQAQDTPAQTPEATAQTAPQSAAQARPAAPEQAPAQAQPAAQVATHTAEALPDLPPLDTPPPSFGANKRFAASGLYQKFAS